MNDQPRQPSDLEIQVRSDLATLVGSAGIMAAIAHQGSPTPEQITAEAQKLAGLMSPASPIMTALAGDFSLAAKMENVRQVKATIIGFDFQTKSNRLAIFVASRPTEWIKDGKEMLVTTRFDGPSRAQYDAIHEAVVVGNAIGQQAMLTIANEPPKDGSPSKGYKFVAAVQLLGPDPEFDPSQYKYSPQSVLEQSKQRDALYSRLDQAGQAAFFQAHPDLFAHLV